MGRPKGSVNKKVEEVTESIEVVENPIVVAPIVHSVQGSKKEELTKLLRHEMHQCYDAEPRGSLTAHFHVMVDKIINLFDNK